MKTIFTALPIYDRIEKQYSQRARYVSGDKTIVCPTITPIHKLPEWQYNVGAVDVGAVVTIELISDSGLVTDITTYFQTLNDDIIDGADTLYQYIGTTLNYLLPVGLHYLRITHANGYVYYSEWILITCVYQNLVSSFLDDYYDTLTSSGTQIIYASSSGGGWTASNEGMKIIKGESLTFICFFTLISGSAPSVTIYNSAYTSISNTVGLVAGLNEITLTATSNCDLAYLGIRNTVDGEWSTSSILLIRGFSEKYLAINFLHSCNLGDINYDHGLQQVLYLETEPMEPTFPYVEKGLENGYGVFVPTFQKQDKLFVIKTLYIAQYIVDVLHRLKLHDTVMLTDLVGDTNTVITIDVEHEWQGDDKYYALATITVDLGDAIIVTGCCTAINECL